MKKFNQSYLSLTLMLRKFYFTYFYNFYNCATYIGAVLKYLIVNLYDHDYIKDYINLL